ncbi:hypothetical protein BDZ97DRAFT_1919530 [Flammula alnicola]|nr:hypothetical protein BDZ97DRAFT_1919530 [Flammula alnicola]
MNHLLVGTLTCSPHGAYYRVRTDFSGNMATILRVHFDGGQGPVHPRYTFIDVEDSAAGMPCGFILLDPNTNNVANVGVMQTDTGPTTMEDYSPYHVFERTANILRISFGTMGDLRKGYWRWNDNQPGHYKLFGPLGRGRAFRLDEYGSMQILGNGVFTITLTESAALTNRVFLWHMTVSAFILSRSV